MIERPWQIKPKTLGRFYPHQGRELPAANLKRPSRRNIVRLLDRLEGNPTFTETLLAAHWASLNDIERSERRAVRNAMKRARRAQR